jgi:hypothetical protein
LNIEQIFIYHEGIGCDGDIVQFGICIRRYLDIMDTRLAVVPAAWDIWVAKSTGVSESLCALSNSGMDFTSHWGELAPYSCSSFSEDGRHSFNSSSVHSDPLLDLEMAAHQTATRGYLGILQISTVFDSGPGFCRNIGIAPNKYVNNPVSL